MWNKGSETGCRRKNEVDITIMMEGWGKGKKQMVLKIGKRISWHYIMQNICGNIFSNRFHMTWYIFGKVLHTRMHHSWVIDQGNLLDEARLSTITSWPSRWILFSQNHNLTGRWWTHISLLSGHGFIW